MILKETVRELPLDWVNLNSYRDSTAYRKEIYLIEQNNVINDLIYLFYSLFGNLKNSLSIYNKSWWDFCLDTWDFNKDTYNYDLEGKSTETQEYLKLLKESQIEINYSGCCICENWDRFLQVVLGCIINHRAPYSPIFFDMENKFFFYFHHTGSIGFYYKEENTVVQQILLKANKYYKVEN